MSFRKLLKLNVPSDSLGVNTVLKISRNSSLQILTHALAAVPFSLPTQFGPSGRKLLLIIEYTIIETAGRTNSTAVLKMIATRRKNATGRPVISSSWVRSAMYKPIHKDRPLKIYLQYRLKISRRFSKFSTHYWPKTKNWPWWTCSFLNLLWMTETGTSW